MGEGEGEVGDDDLDGEPEEYPYDSNAGRSLVDVASNAISQCPVENGVMRTAWGAVAAGPLIAGMNGLFFEIRLECTKIVVFHFSKRTNQASPPVWCNKMWPPWNC